MRLYASKAGSKKHETPILVLQAVVENAGPRPVLRQGFVTPLKGKKGLHRGFEAMSEE